MLRIVGFTIMMLSLSSQVIWGQMATPAEPGIVRTAFPNVRGLSADYHIGPGDMLEIQVVEAEELGQTLRVTAAGEINFLSIGSLQVQDLTAAEIENTIASALRGKKLVQDPQVLVFIKEYHSKKIYLMGEFAFPCEFIMAQNLTAFDAMLMAGGLGPHPARYGYLHRHSANLENGPPSTQVIAKPDTPQEGTQIYRIDMSPLLEGKSPEPNPILREGDYLIVPRKQVESFFVLGDVTSPSNFDIPEGKTITVTQAIAFAGGPTFTAKPSKTILARKNADGKRFEIPVNFTAIVKGKKKDISLQPDDIVYVPSGKLPMLREQYVTRTDLYVEGTVFRVGRYYQLPAEQRNGIRNF